MARKQKMDGSEMDLVYCPQYYSWVRGIKKWLKRKMNKRWRRQGKKECSNGED